MSKKAIKKEQKSELIPKDCLKVKRGLRTFLADSECHNCPSMMECPLIDHAPEVNKWED